MKEYHVCTVCIMNLICRQRLSLDYMQHTFSLCKWERDLLLTFLIAHNTVCRNTEMVLRPGYVQAMATDLHLTKTLSMMWCMMYVMYLDPFKNEDSAQIVSVFIFDSCTIFTLPRNFHFQHYVNHTFTLSKLALQTAICHNCYFYVSS